LAYLEHRKDPVTLEITDYVSFYTLPSAILQAGTKYSTLDAAYLFYYGSDVAFKPNGEGLLKKRLEELVTDAMIIAVQVGSLYDSPNSPHRVVLGKIRCIQRSHSYG
jgi:Myristoyl-CoA:protein N-myristoyltransferase, C-terminal domain